MIAIGIAIIVELGIIIYILLRFVTTKNTTKTINPVKDKDNTTNTGITIHSDVKDYEDNNDD